MPIVNPMIWNTGTNEQRREHERDCVEQRERRGARRDDGASRAEEMGEEILVAPGRAERSEGTGDPRAEEETCAPGTARVGMLTAKGVPSPPTDLTAASMLFSG